MRTKDYQDLQLIYENMQIKLMYPESAFTIKWDWTIGDIYESHEDLDESIYSDINENEDEILDSDITSSGSYSPATYWSPAEEPDIDANFDPKDLIIIVAAFKGEPLADEVHYEFRHEIVEENFTWIKVQESFTPLSEEEVNSLIEYFNRPDPSPYDVEVMEKAKNGEIGWNRGYYVESNHYAYFIRKQAQSKEDASSFLSDI